MAWEWSHTAEAYNNALENLNRLPKRELLTILREWAYKDREDRGTIRRRAGSTRIPGFRLPAGLARLDRSHLADLIWERAESLATCDNGGFRAWVCPDGCHTVSFDPKD